MSQIEPTIKLPDIEIEIGGTFENSETSNVSDGNTASEDTAKNLLEFYGQKIPVVQVNDNVISLGNVLNVKFNTKINSLPTFVITINDTYSTVRNNLSTFDEQNYLDIVNVFIGFQNWYIKFQGIITNVRNIGHNDTLILSGTINIPKLLEREQKSYSDKSVDEILKDICQNSEIGYFSLENENLLKTYDVIINHNLRRKDFISRCIKTFTNNIWSIDFLYYLHVSNIEKLRSQTEPDKYTIKYDGTKISPTPIKFSNKLYPEDDSDLSEDEKNEFDTNIRFELISTNSNFGKTNYNNSEKYYVNSTEITSSSSVPNNGTGTIIENTFSDFEQIYNPFYENIVNKELAGKLFNIKLNRPIFEIVPFSIVDFELWTVNRPDMMMPTVQDTINSGLKIVIGQDIEFNLQSLTENEYSMTQSLILI